MGTTARALAGFLDVPVEQLANPTNAQRAYLIESLIMVEEPETSKAVPLILNHMQREIIASLTDHEITVKWRRGGLTSIYAASAWINLLTRPGWTVELYAHDWRTAKRIFEDVVMFQFNHLPEEFRPTPSARGGHYIEFEEIGSRFTVDTVGASEGIAEKKGQARTINELLLTEFARFSYAEQFMVSIENCLPTTGGIVRIDSIPNGQNAFYSRFKQATAGASRFKGRFFPWWYGTNTRLELEKDEAEDNILGLGPITADEDLLGEGNPEADDRRGKDKLTPEQIKWRRWKLKDIAPLGTLTSQDRFRVEYPEDPASCFLHSGRPFFRASDLVVRVKELSKARIDESKYPHDHVIGMDTSTGDGSGHPAGIAVIDISVTPAEQVYEWIGWEPTDSQAERLVEVQRRFPGLLVVERNTPGDSVLQLLRRWDIDGVYMHREKELRESMTGPARRKPGFPTSSVTKPRIFTELEHALRHSELLLCGKETVSDLKGMQYDDSNKIVYESAFDSGERGIVTHGELAIAIALAWEGRKAGGVGVG